MSTTTAPPAGAAGLPVPSPLDRLEAESMLGCYPLTGAVESQAETVAQVIAEISAATTSERAGRLVDHDATASMQPKKQEGYF